MPVPRKRYAADRSERARQLVEDGKIGGARPGAGRPPKANTESQGRRPAAEAVAAAARQHSESIAQVFVDVLQDDTASDSEKLRAMRALLGVETTEAKIQLEESKQSDLDPVTPESRKEAEANLSRALANPLVASRIAAALTAANR